MLDRSKLDPAKVGTAAMGNVIQAGNKKNPARQPAVHSGIPVDVPAITVNRVCGSGAQGIASAAQKVMLGMLDRAVAGGMENMDMAPYLLGNGRWGYCMGDGELYDSMLRDGLNDAFSGETQVGTRKIWRSLAKSPVNNRIAGHCAHSNVLPQHKRPGNSRKRLRRSRFTATKG